MKTIVFVLLEMLCVISFSSCEKAQIFDEEGNQKKSTNYSSETDDDDDNGGSIDLPPDTPTTTDTKTHKYHVGDVISVSEFISNQVDAEVYVVGYVVGACYKKHDNTTLEPPFTNAGKSSVLIADDPNEKNMNRMLCIKLKVGDMKNSWNLEDNPDIYRQKVKIMGYQTYNYLGFIAIKDVISYELL